MLDAMVCPALWAVRHFSSVDLKDERLNRRLIKVGQAMASNPSGSIPDQCGSWGDTKATYRLFADPSATFEALSQGHWQQTRQASQANQVTLLIQDTTWLSYGDHPATEGLGRHGKGKSRGDYGLHLHSVLAIKPLEDQAAILGLAHAKLWARTAGLYNADQASRSQRRKSPDRESLRWSQAIEQIGSAPAGSRLVHVGDREADLFDLYEQTTSLSNVGFVIRANHDRNALPGHDTAETIGKEKLKGSRLKALIRSVAPATGMQLDVAANNGRVARVAQLKISYCPLTLYAPQVRSRQQKALRCWCVRVFEPNPPAGVQAIEWILLSSEAVESIADAQRIVLWYHWRWLIEEYHRCLKSGCKVEQRQLASIQSLEPLIAMLSILATRLLQLKNDARIKPDAPARDHAPQEMVQMLCRVSGGDWASLSLKDFVIGVAKHGGFLGRKHDGNPGWQTLWRGWKKLSLLCEGYQMARLERDMGKG